MFRYECIRLGNYEIRGEVEMIKTPNSLVGNIVKPRNSLTPWVLSQIQIVKDWMILE